MNAKALWHPVKDFTMWLRFHFVTAFGVIAFCSLAMLRSVVADPSPPENLFRQTIHPLLQSKCYPCHGEDNKNIEGELDVSTREGLLAGGESGKPALVPGKPDESPMFRAVLRQEKLKMPPKDRNKLAPEEIEQLRRWIADGAVWGNLATATNPQPKWNYKAEDIWAFQPARKNLKTPEDAHQVIDLLIQQKLQEKNLKPAPPVDKVTLLRRATYDLTGLPPTPKEIDAFVSDKRTNAFNDVIERLLGSPHYGEQWARHWLDVVRYADTDGYSNDYERPNAWRYRDYVIRSFNADEPYDRFVVEQIAGDECFHSDAGNPDERDKLIAVGMLRMGPWEQTAMSVAAVTRQLFLDDVTAQIGATYLGLTTGCARCHDHKFDPIPTKDYYRLQSIFAPTQFETRNVAFLPAENVAGFERKIASVQEAMKKLKTRISEITGKHDRAVKKYLAEHGYKNLREVPFKERPKKDLGLTSADQSIEKTLRKRIEYRERELQRYRAESFSVSSGGMGTNKTETPKIHILVGGSLESPGEAVTPGLLSAVYHSDDAKNPSAWNKIPEATDGRRLKLAQWIASPENPLTARVMVNRIWQYHFGKGIVRSSNNFGKMGDKPTHPELLDWLANYFVEHGWSVKEIHRLIMSSRAYQLSATPDDAEATKKNDPEEKWFSHFLPRRLTAEELRDSMLSVSGELSETRGGPPVFPEINLEAALQPRHIMGSLAPIYVPSSKRDERNRRTIYTVQIRSVINPMLQVFNSAPTEFSCERRDATTVTPQAFALFNSQQAYDSALAMAARLDKMSKSRAQQIDNAFRLTYGRNPTDIEKKLCLSHLDELTKYHRQTKPVDFSFPAKVEREMVEELTGEPFQFAEDWDLSDYEPNLRPSEVTPEVRALADLCLTILNSHEFVYIY